MADRLPPRRFAALLDDLYRGVEDPNAWTNAVCRIGDTLRTPVIAQQSYDLVRKTGVCCGVRGLSAASQEAYNAHYSRTNPWMSRARGRISPGGLVVSDDLLPEAELPGTEWYEEFLPRAGFYRSMGTALEIEGDVSTTILFARPRALGAYTEEDRRLLLAFAPHLRNVHRFRARLAAFDIVSGSLSATLDALGHGVLLAAPDGRISFLNPTARRILDLRDGLSLRPDGLHAAVPSEGALLLRRIAAVRSDPASFLSGNELIRVSRPSGARSFEVLVQPISTAGGSSAFAHRGALIFLHDPEAVPAAATTCFRTFFGLTPAEARLAELVAEGADLATAAARLEITIETARTHLKRIFGKTNTHRQAQLAQLLLGSLARAGPR